MKIVYINQHVLKCKIMLSVHCLEDKGPVVHLIWHARFVYTIYLSAVCLLHVRYHQKFLARSLRSCTSATAESINLSSSDFFAFVHIPIPRNAGNLHRLAHYQTIPPSKHLQNTSLNFLTIALTPKESKGGPALWHSLPTC